MKTLIHLVPDGAQALSLTRFVAEVAQLDPALVRRWILAGHVLVDGQPGKPGRYLIPGQTVTVSPPPPVPHAALPEDLPLPIRYCDADLVVVAKPGGMATHPGPGWWRGSCVNALLYLIPDWPGVGGVAGPGIVHRLDRDTSGLLVFARSDPAHQALLQAAAARRLQRHYLAWVEGRLSGKASIDAPLARDPQDPHRMAVLPGGKPALTHYECLAHEPGRSLLALRLETGRNHQIRVHLAHLGHPVVGDPVYGSPGPFMALHATRLAFAHPITGEPLDFYEPPPWGGEDEWTAHQSKLGENRT